MFKKLCAPLSVIAVLFLAGCSSEEPMPSKAVMDSLNKPRTMGNMAPPVVPGKSGSAPTK